MARLWKALGLPPLARVALVGGGGKTSSLFQLGRESLNFPTPALLTTTTRMHFPTLPWLHCVPFTSIASAAAVTYVYGDIGAEGKVVGLPPADLNELAERYPQRPLLYEADGSAGKPVKIHGEHEPVIASCTGHVVVVMGMSAFGRPLDESTVHRHPLLQELKGHLLDAEAAEGLLRRIIQRLSGTARVLLLLNQVTNDRLPHARAIGERLPELRVVAREHDWCETIQEGHE